jgi:hypothetical protein
MGRTSEAEREALEGIERTLEKGERNGALAALAWLASRGVTLDEAALHGARKRAVLLLATGGDPRSGLVLDGRAAASLAAELEASLPRTALSGELDRLRGDTADLPLVSAALGELVSDPALCFRALACALLAEELEPE